MSGRPWSTLAWLLAASLTTAACGPSYSHRVVGSAAISDRPVTFTASQLARSVHREVNRARHEHGLSKLSWNPSLSPIAYRHSRDMSVRRYFAHVNPDGEGPHERYLRGGHKCRVPIGGRRFLTAGENIFSGHKVRTWKIFSNGTKQAWHYNTLAALADRVVVGWLNSPEHRDNLLKPAWRSEAIGVYIDGAGAIHVTQNFC